MAIPARRYSPDLSTSQRADRVKMEKSERVKMLEKQQSSGPIAAIGSR
jgi:hypothetical protein